MHCEQASQGEERAALDSKANQQHRSGECRHLLVRADARFPGRLLLPGPYSGRAAHRLAPGTGVPCRVLLNRSASVGHVRTARRACPVRCSGTLPVTIG